MIIRDALNIIVQHEKSNPTYRDGGDSSRSSGMMALFGSKIDQHVITMHWEPIKGFIRHPTQKLWNDPKDFSRDQLIPLVAGLRESGYSEIVKEEFWSRKYWLGVCPNLDLIGPEFYLHLILCGEIWQLFWLLPILYLFLVVHILWVTMVFPKQEQNQTIAMAKVAGLLWLWRLLHPYWRESLIEYWGGWRDQREIAEWIIYQIEK